MSPDLNTANVDVRARLLRGRSQVASHLWRVLRSGSHVLRLAVPARVRAGHYALGVTVRPSSGAAKRLTRTIRLRR